jgi:membrane protein implicated in regulation of membrane protease activity
MDETVVIPAGTTVDILQIDGATAVVYPRER